MATAPTPMTTLAVLLPGSKNLILGTWIIGNGTSPSVKTTGDRLDGAGRRGAVHWKPQRSGGVAVWPSFWAARRRSLRIPKVRGYFSQGSPLSREGLETAQGEILLRHLRG